MADVRVPDIATASPASSDTVLGVFGGAVRLFQMPTLSRAMPNAYFPGNLRVGADEPDTNYTGTNSFSVGEDNTQSSNRCIQSGLGNTQSGYNNLQFGAYSTQSGRYNTQAAYYSVQTGNYNTQAGYGHTQSGFYGHQYGAGGQQAGNYNLQGGTLVTQDGDYNTQSGYYNTQAGNYNLQMGGGLGVGNTQTADHSFQFGTENNQAGKHSFQIGVQNLQNVGTMSAYDGYCTQAGYVNEQSAGTQMSFQFGIGNTQSGYLQVQFGLGCTQSGYGNFQAAFGSTQTGFGGYQFGSDLDDGGFTQTFMFGSTKTAIADNTAYFWLDNGVRLKPVATAPASPENGTFYYDSALHQFRGYANGAWVAFN